MNFNILKLIFAFMLIFALYVNKVDAFEPDTKWSDYKLRLYIVDDKGFLIKNVNGSYEKRLINNPGGFKIAPNAKKAIYITEQKLFLIDLEQDTFKVIFENNNKELDLHFFTWSPDSNYLSIIMKILDSKDNYNNLINNYVIKYFRIKDHNILKSISLSKSSTSSFYFSKTGDSIYYLNWNNDLGEILNCSFKTNKIKLVKKQKKGENFYLYLIKDKLFINSSARYITYNCINFKDISTDNKEIRSEYGSILIKQGDKKEKIFNFWLFDHKFNSGFDNVYWLPDNRHAIFRGPTGYIKIGNEILFNYGNHNQAYILDSETKKVGALCEFYKMAWIKKVPGV
ncbi:hypothetical protein ACFLZV_01510 [Candidatus Margulisiibacteriota bacterium]